MNRDEIALTVVCAAVLCVSVGCASLFGKADPAETIVDGARATRAACALADANGVSLPKEARDTCDVLEALKK